MMANLFNFYQIIPHIVELFLEIVQYIVLIPSQSCNSIDYFVILPDNLSIS